MRSVVRVSRLMLSLSLFMGVLVAVTPARAQTTVLHDQYDNLTSTTTNSQNYDSVNDDYDNEAADDFEVPAGTTWTIQTFEVDGQYNSPDDRPSSLNVRIYHDANGLPGALVEEWLNLQPTGGFGEPDYSNFSIPLPDAPALSPGRYWISVQVNLVSGEHWFWRNRSETDFNPAAWRNPGGAWETPCEDWGRRAATCAPSGDLSTSNPDQVFRLIGTAGTGTGTTGVALDMDADDGAPTNSSGNPGACDLSTAGSDPARESSAVNEIDPTTATAIGNFHRICAAAFSSGQTNAGRVAQARITFTIQGPGRIYAAGSGGSCNVSARPAAATTVKVTANAAGYAFACLYSQAVGRTTVTASSGQPAVSATGTKDWVVDPATARFIQLCQRDIAGPNCDTADAFNEPGDEHEFTARVTDAQGNPVANVPVEFRETGSGVFVPGETNTTTVNTDANGLARAILTSDEEGESSVVAEISPSDSTGSFRGPGVDDDECEQPSGQDGEPAAGNCVSQALIKRWQPEPPTPLCDDGEDNDGDQLVDMEDPGCNAPEDGSEDPFNQADPTRVRHERRISVRFTDGTGARNNGLVVFGRLRLADGGDNPDCIRQVPVNVQRKQNDRWVTKKSTTTNRRGRYAVEIFDLAGRYRAVAVQTELLDEELNIVNVCVRALKAKRHRHRR